MCRMSIHYAGTFVFCLKFLWVSKCLYIYIHTQVALVQHFLPQRLAGLTGIYQSIPVFLLNDDMARNEDDLFTRLMFMYEIFSRRTRASVYMNKFVFFLLTGRGRGVLRASKRTKPHIFF